MEKVSASCSVSAAFEWKLQEKQEIVHKRGREREGLAGEQKKHSPLPCHRDQSLRVTRMKKISATDLP
jgi:hypothetical protein